MSHPSPRADRLAATVRCEDDPDAARDKAMSPWATLLTSMTSTSPRLEVAAHYDESPLWWLVNSAIPASVAVYFAMARATSGVNPAHRVVIHAPRIDLCHYRTIAAVTDNPIPMADAREFAVINPSQARTRAANLSTAAEGCTDQLCSPCGSATRCQAGCTERPRPAIYVDRINVDKVDRLNKPQWVIRTNDAGDDLVAGVRRVIGRPRALRQPLLAVFGSPRLEPFGAPRDDKTLAATAEA